MPGSTGPDPDQRNSRWLTIGLPTLIGALALLVTVYAWLVPDPLRLGPEAANGADDNNAPRPPQNSSSADATPRRPGASSPPVTGDSAPAGTPVYLDTLRPVIGGARRTELPRDLVGMREYDRSVVIACPTNESNNNVSEITYQLSGRYLDFTATLNVYAPEDDSGTGSDLSESLILITPVLVTEERNGRLATSSRKAVVASPGKPAVVQARVDGSEQLKIRVECESPRTSAVLSGATLTRVNR